MWIGARSSTSAKRNSRRKCTLAKSMKGLLADSCLKRKMAGEDRALLSPMALKWVIYPKKSQNHERNSEYWHTAFLPFSLIWPWPWPGLTFFFWHKKTIFSSHWLAYWLGFTTYYVTKSWAYFHTTSFSLQLSWSRDHDYSFIIMTIHSFSDSTQWTVLGPHRQRSQRIYCQVWLF
jgi:hypothetical protein